MSLFTFLLFTFSNEWKSNPDSRMNREADCLDSPGMELRLRVNATQSHDGATPQCSSSNERKGWQDVLGEISLCEQHFGLFNAQSGLCN